MVSRLLVLRTREKSTGAWLELMVSVPFVEPAVASMCRDDDDGDGTVTGMTGVGNATAAAGDDDDDDGISVAAAGEDTDEDGIS